MENLNDAMIENADGPNVPLREGHGQYQTADERIEVIFDLLPERLCQEILRWPAVVGCVAWLTNEDILTALQHPQQVSIIVNKEDFLRPDSGGTWHEQKIRVLYRLLPDIDRYDHFSVVPYNTSGDSTTEAVRCVGVRKPRGEVPPRMHHKFLVFCDWEISIWNTYDAELAEDEYAMPWRGFYGSPADEYDYQGGRRAVPRAVWTGSFNFSENGRRSLENAVIIRDPDIAAQFYAEWGALVGISEPLDWTSEYVHPEYRIGT